MKCSKCDFENSAEAIFCGKCGSKIERLCPECKSPNPASHDFCNKCGQTLTAGQQSPEPISETLSDDDKLAKIQKYLPKGIAEKILAQKGRIDGERKQVTVMFCDLVGFTSMSEKLDPEEIYPIIDKVQEILIHKVHDYEGIVNKMIGDGIMALFGAPIAFRRRTTKGYSFSFLNPPRNNQIQRDTQRTSKGPTKPANENRHPHRTGSCRDNWQRPQGRVYCCGKYSQFGI